MNSLLALMAADPSGAGSMVTTLVTFVLIILIFYFLIIRPQKKRDKESKAMIEAMKKGDKVVTIGGIHGTVVTVKDATVIIKVDDSARLEFSKSAISTVTSRDAVKVAPADSKKKEEEKKVEAPAKEEKSDASAEEEKN